MTSPFSLIMPRLPSEYLGSKLTGWIARNLARNLWKRSVHDAAFRCQIPAQIASHLHHSRCLARFFLSVFDADSNIPSAADIAISFAFHLRELKANRETIPAISNAQIRSFAACLRRNWLSGIQSNYFLRSRFKESRDTSAAHFLQAGGACLNELDEVLESNALLPRAYFQTFAANDATHHIYVWLGDDSFLVHFDERRSVIKVPVNLARGCGLGFFIPSCDYSLSEVPYKNRLAVCHADDTPGCEYGAFQDAPFFGIATGDFIWVR